MATIAPSKTLAAAPQNSQPTATTNILLSSFPGLDIPRTLCIPVATDSTVAQVFETVSNHLPINLYSSRLCLTTHGNKQLSPRSSEPLHSLLTSSDASILSLRLSVPLCGGKGGFGSQLRAAGGRMSSRKKRNQQDSNASSRNLDGRRLRTVKEAKALAEYLAIKPDMDKKAKEERRKRWQEIVEASDRREEEIRSGNGGRVRLDGQWVEDKEEQESKMRDAVIAAMGKGLVRPESDESGVGSEGIGSGSGSEEPEEDDATPDVNPAEKGKGKLPAIVPSKPAATRKVYGWDDEDEDLSDGP